MAANARILIAATLTGTLILLSGCGPKPVGPYAPQSKTNMPEGQSIEYTGGEGTITEEISPGEESLAAGGTGESMGSFALNGDQTSDEYKKTYGRSTTQMQPIYFDFDQATVRDDQIMRMEHNADYLKNNPSSKVLIEGNSDERGTNEYNLALGERRAINAKNYLTELGVEEYRIRTLSYGEERPLFMGQSEFDFGQNRRDDFIIE